MVDKALLEEKLKLLAEYISDLEEQKHVSPADLKENKVLRRYLFGSLVKPGHFLPGVSDVDVAIAGLEDKDFFPAAAFLPSELGIDVDLIQLERHPLAETIRKEGIRWKKRA